MINFPDFVHIVEVGPRDGLQNESSPISTATKIELINRLSQTGLQSIEVSSFVSPKWIPQLADAKEVFTNIEKKPSIDYPVLVPNEQGLTSALDAQVKTIAVFTTVSETFCKKNINCTIAESLATIKNIISVAKENNLKIRAYISCVLGCPYEGEMDFKQCASMAKQLIDWGCYEVSLGDTIGQGTPFKAQQLIDSCLQEVPPQKLAVHFHDTYGQALANIFAVLPLGIQTIDSSIAGLGGCPYAHGASGNVATEDVLYMLHGMGIKTGVQLTEVIKVSHFISDQLARPPRSKVSLAKK